MSEFFTGSQSFPGKKYSWALHESQEFLGFAYSECNSQSKIPSFSGKPGFCSGFLGFPWVGISCFSMKAWNSTPGTVIPRFPGKNPRFPLKPRALSWLSGLVLEEKFGLSKKTGNSHAFLVFLGFLVSKEQGKPRKLGFQAFFGVSTLFQVFFLARVITVLFWSILVAFEGFEKIKQSRVADPRWPPFWKSCRSLHVMWLR